jgi:hypothetical protein
MKVDNLDELINAGAEIPTGDLIPDATVDRIVAYSAPLTYKQKLFVNEYCVDFNVTAAYKRAFSAMITEDKSEVNIKRCAFVMWNNPGVQEAILLRVNALSQASRIKKEWILGELMTIYEELKFDGKPQIANKLKVLDAITKLQGYAIMDQLMNANINGPLQINVQIIDNRDNITPTTDDI